MVPPDSSFHSQTRFDELLAPEVAAVDLPLHELPLDHHLRRDAGMVRAGLPEHVLRPRMRSKRQRMSWSVLLRACPMWSEPVTFGGGMTIV